MISLCVVSSFITPMMRSSNCPLYLVPAMSEDISRAMMRLSSKAEGTFMDTIRSASPSTMAVLPTPGSPMSIGLFFFRRLSIWAMRSISFSRPTTLSNFFSAAFWVMSVPYLSRKGVSLSFSLDFLLVVGSPARGWLGGSISSSSSSSSS